MSYGNYPDLENVKRILIIKMRHHGDVLLTSPVFACLKKKIPDAAIDVLIYKETLPMLEGHPAISDYLIYDRKWKALPIFKRIYREFSLLKQIKRNEYDLVINLTEGDRGAIAALISGSLFKVGFDPEAQGFKGKKKIYTHIVKNCKTPRHTVEKQLDALRRIGIFPRPQDKELFLHIPKCSSEKMQDLLQQKGLIKGEYVVFHPVSRWRFKCPPIANIARMVQELLERGEQVVLTSGPDPMEIAMVEQILAQLPENQVLNLAGQTTLKELAALIQMSRCLICVDSVPLHMASALKTPVIVLFGPSSEKNWGPWMHSQYHILAQKVPCRPCFMDGCGGSKYSDCLAAITELELLQAYDSLFPNKSRRKIPILT